MVSTILPKGAKFLKILRTAVFSAFLLLSVFLLHREAHAISAQAYLTMEASTGRVIAAQNADEPRPIASTTKILSALLTLEAGALDEPFTVDPNAILVEGSSMGLQTGDIVTLRTLAQGMLLASGNDAANAAAVRICGNIPDFAKRMNERARQLGMTHSSFVTPSGLDAEGHVSTAYDMALLARAAIANPDFLSICRETSMKLSYGNPPYDRWLRNHNKLLNEYEGCIGVKTGFTKKAGRCLVSAATRDGITVICVTLDAPDDWADHKTLLDGAFAALQSVTLPTDAISGITVPIVGSDGSALTPIALAKATVLSLWFTPSLSLMLTGCVG